MTLEVLVLELHTAADRAERAADGLREATLEFQAAKRELASLVRELRELRQTPEPWRGLNLN